ncbi:MAG: hypothetical protein Tsb0013_07130 [Phycisphaerales bacterium]
MGPGFRALVAAKDPQMLKRLSTCVPLIAAIALACSWAVTPVVPQVHAFQGDEEDTVVISELLLTSGQTVRGVILEETATSILFELHMPGFPTIERRYQRSEIENITRNVDQVAAARDDVTMTPDDEDDDDRDSSSTANTDPNAAQLYYVKFTGGFGQQVSQTPIQAIIEDINKTFDDAIPNPSESGPATIVDPEVRDKHIVVMEIACQPGRGFDELWRAIEFIQYIEDEIHARGRRVVMLIQSAYDGAAFLPWLSNEIYFTSEGFMAVTSDLEDFDIGDDMVNEKQISLRLGRAQGFAILGGYPEVGPAIIKAMCRSRYWLSVLWTGATPRVELRRPTAEMMAQGWEVLSDDGIDDREDSMQQGIRNPNDQLYLRSDTAFRLGVSKGTVTDREELLFLLGVHRNYNWVENESDEILADWQREIDRFVEMAHPGDQRTRPGRLWRDFNDIQVAGDENDRKKARGQQLRLLKQIRSFVNRVAEVVDPNGQLVSQIELMIYQIQTQQQLDSEN